MLASDGTCHTQATTGPAPPCISMCAATALDHETLVLFGGSDKNQAMSDTVYTLSTKTWQWRKLVSRGKTTPTARSSACMVSVDDESTCLVFGGAGIGADGYAGGKGLRGFDETWLLKVNEEFADWTALEHSDTLPPPRVAASLNKFPRESGKFLLTGGWNPTTAETFEEPWAIEL